MEDNKKLDENLDMDLFDQEDIELFLDDNPEENSDSEKEPSVEEGEEENNKLGEDQKDSEDVAEEEDSEEEGDDSDEQSDDDSPDNLYSSFASVLNEKGLLPSLNLQEKEIKDVDDLIGSIKEEIDNQSKQYLISKIGEEGYEALEKGISLSEYQQYQETTNNLDSITDDIIENDLELAKKIIEQDYLSQGMDSNRVNRILKKSIDLGEETIIEDAKESLESLKAIQAKKLEQIAEQRQQQIKQQQELQEKIDNDLKNNIYNNDEFIKGIKVSKAIKDRVYDSITKIVGESPTGVAENKLMRQRRENPIEFDTKLYYIYEMTDGFKDFSKIISRSESKAISKLEDQLRKQKFDTGSRPSYIDDPDSYNSNIGDELVL